MMRTIIILACCLLAHTGYAQQNADSTKKKPTTEALLNAIGPQGAASRLGKRYPEFDFTTTDGRHVTSASCRGKVVLLNCWFEGCHPCEAEFGALNELYDLLKADTDFIMIALAREPAPRLPQLLQQYGLRYPNTSVVNDAYKYNLSSGFPTTIVLDGTGNVAWFKCGGSSKETVARGFVMKEFLPAIRKELAALEAGRRR